MVVCAELDGTRFQGHWLLERRSPRVTYETREEAENEAERLATQNPGESFAVLESVAFVATKPYYPALVGNPINVPMWERATPTPQGGR